MNRPLIVILGPTASGKSSLGVKLAKRFHGVVISADSRQVYRGMDLGTGKITKREMASVPHYLLDVASPRGQYSVARYVRDVQRVIKKITPTTPIFLVGGSPFYIDALTKPNSFSPVPPNLKLRRRLAKKTTPQLIALLKKVDTQRLTTIDPANRRRLIRAIEIATHSSSPVSGGVGRRTSSRTGVVNPAEQFRILKLGLRPSKEQLHRNIERRVDVRLRQGMIREVERLHQQGLSWTKLDAFGLEYRFLSRHLRGQLTKTETLSQLKSAIKDFAKRQMTWWKRDQDIQWLTNATEARQLTQRFLQ